MNKRTLYATFCRRNNRRQVMRASIIVLSLMLLMQGFGFNAPVSAQRNGPPPAPPPPGDEISATDEKPPDDGSGQIYPTEAGVTVLPTVDLWEAANQQALAPASNAPVELKAIHEPFSRPAREGTGVGIVRTQGGSRPAPSPQSRAARRRADRQSRRRWHPSRRSLRRLRLTPSRATRSALARSRPTRWARSA